MPPAPARRQPDRPADIWFSREATLALVQDVQRQAIPELTRVFGHGGLYLRPSVAVPATLSGNMLANVLSLHRQGGAFAGELACQDRALPVASGCLSLVYVLFVLETSPDPAALLAESARVLKPDGVALILSLNPWVPGHLRWAFQGLRALDGATVAMQVREAGLDVQRRHSLGPVWSSPQGLDLASRRAPDPLARLRMASLTVARRRDPGLTPLRAIPPAMKFRPGVSAG
jgi:SAM-dependent methyltransferase